VTLTAGEGTLGSVGGARVGAPGDLRNNGVVKFAGEAAERVARALLTAGPSTATDLAEALEITSAGIRRILSGLIDAGLVASRDKVPYGPSPKRGRGRPSSVFSLTPAGRAACDQSYDALAVDALRFMSESYGPLAVEAFATDRANRLASAMIPEGALTATPQEVAVALSLAGYAAEVEPLGGVSIQLCQHHCPVIDAAREFPAMCEAETAALSRVLGTHVTRLATLAHGDEVCTTVIPLDNTHVASRDALGKVSV
jgi:predicted ArsR family transcriptional regulator